MKCLLALGTRSSARSRHNRVQLKWSLQKKKNHFKSIFYLPALIFHTTLIWLSVFTQLFGYPSPYFWAPCRCPHRSFICHKPSPGCSLSQTPVGDFAELNQEVEAATATEREVQQSYCFSPEGRINPEPGAWQVRSKRCYRHAPKGEGYDLHPCMCTCVHTDVNPLAHSVAVKHMQAHVKQYQGWTGDGSLNRKLWCL